MAKPEADYNVHGVLSDPFTALNKAEKQKQQELLRKQKEDEKKAKEAELKAEKDAKKEEARLLKEAALAEKIKKRTVENEQRHTEEAKRKEEEDARIAKKKQEDEAKQKSEKDALNFRKQQEEQQQKEKKAREEAEARQKIENEKRAAREKRDNDLKEEESNADLRAKEIAASRDLQKKIEEAKKKGMIPDNFIPVIWGVDHSARKEIEEILEKPYWEPAKEPVKMPEPKKDIEVVKSSARNEDSWLQEKRQKQTTVPWSSQLMKAVAQQDLPPPAPQQEKEKKITLVEHYRNIVGGGNEAKSAPVVRSSEKSPDLALQVAPMAKAQAAELWAAIARGETARPLSYDGFTLEAFGKVDAYKASVKEVIDLVAAMATTPPSVPEATPQDEVPVQAPVQDSAPVQLPTPSQEAQSYEPPSGAGPQSTPAPTVSPASAPTISQQLSAKPQETATKPSTIEERRLIADAAREAQYGKKPALPQPSNYGPKPAKSVQEAVYGTKQSVQTTAAEMAGAPAPSTEPTPSAPVASPYGRKPQVNTPQPASYKQQAQSKSPYGQKVAPESIYGSKADLAPALSPAAEAAGPTEPEEKQGSIYGRMSFSKPSPAVVPTSSVQSPPSVAEAVEPPEPSVTPAAHPTPVSVGVSEEGYGSRIATARAAAALPAAAATPVATESEYEYGTRQQAQPKQPQSGAGAAPEISSEQIMEMINRMTQAQKQQACDMLRAAVSKGHPLSPQQQQLHALLEKTLGNADPSAAPTTPPKPPGDKADGSPDGKKGLFFQLPKKQKFQFGIPGREILTLRHFEKLVDKKKMRTEKVLLVICNDISFVCKQAAAENAGVYELFDKPTQRDKVSAADDSSHASSFALKLGKEQHVLIAQSSEEKQYWIQVINTRANFVPTEKLVS